MSQLRVSARSNPNAVAGAVSGVVRDHGRADVHVIGAGALNQAVKAVAIARSHLCEHGIDLVCLPAFVLLEVDGEQRTAINLVVEDRRLRTITLPEASGDVTIDATDQPALDGLLTSTDGAPLSSSP